MFDMFQSSDEEELSHPYTLTTASSAATSSVSYTSHSAYTRRKTPLFFGLEIYFEVLLLQWICFILCFSDDDFLQNFQFLETCT